jgi:cytochrome c biogenesis protein CcmG, thiol:disulfide interchange protein DsbE
MPYMARLAVFGVMLIIAASLAGCKKEQSWKGGAPAPAIKVIDLKGASVNLSDFKGRVVVLRFWATGCKICAAEMPTLDRFRKKYPEKELVVLGINMGSSRELVEAYAEGMKLSYPMLLDPEMATSKIYEVKMVPTTFFIDRKGSAKQVIYGEMPRKAFDQIIESLL